MKMMTMLFFIIYVFINIFSCQNDFNDNAIGTKEAITLEIDPENSTEIDPSNFGNIELIIMSSDEEFLLGDIHKYIFRDHKLFLKPYGRGKLLIFSDKGDEYSLIDQVGTGPGEYLEFTDFDVDSTKSHVIVVDGGNRKVLTYSYKGELINETPINFAIKLIKAYSAGNEIQYIIDLGYSNLLPNQSSAYSLNLYTHDWDLITGYFKFSKPRIGMMGDPYMLFSKSAHSIGYYKTFTDSIFHFEGNNMSLAYKLEFPWPVMSYEVFQSDPFGNHFLSNHIANILYDESQSHIYLKYMFKNQVYLTIFDKQNDIMHTYTIPKVKENCVREVFKNILGLRGSKLVIQCSPQNIPCLKGIFQEGLNEGQISELNNIDEYDNNFILLLQLL